MAGPIQALNQRTADAIRDGENSARPAICMGSFPTTGWGEASAASPITFAVAFTTVPSVSYGFQIVGGAAVVVPGRMPRACGFVTDWVTDTQGHYLGAFIAATIDDVSAGVSTTIPGATSPTYTIIHSFTFTGPAYKPLPGLT